MPESSKAKSEAVEKAILEAVPHVRVIIRLVAGGQVADAASDSVFVPAANYLMGVVSDHVAELEEALRVATNRADDLEGYAKAVYEKIEPLAQLIGWKAPESAGDTHD
jgi:hypothetical protein